jgi:ribosomal protein L11 methyltransferase
MAQYFWRRRIAAGAIARWEERLAGLPPQSIVISQKPRAAVAWVEVYSKRFSGLSRLRDQFGGVIEEVPPPRQWVAARVSNPMVRVGKRLAIAESESTAAEWRAGRPGGRVLIIPAGLAFGSGAHATTAMLLRMIERRVRGEFRLSVLDVGTGSGILALAARKLGADIVAALDHDPVAIRVAKQNERANFRQGCIQWRVADLTSPVRMAASLAGSKYHLIVANLYSELLAVGAKSLVQRLRPSGELLISGVLAIQEESVASAIGSLGGIVMIERRRTGKWVAQTWRKS